jgi:hypothetical protein
MDREDRVAGIIGAAQERLELERFEYTRHALHLGGELGRQALVRFGREQLAHPTGIGEPGTNARRWDYPALETLDLCTSARARSGFDQKPGSAWSASSARSRASLAGRSKKLRKLENPPLKLVQPFIETGHRPKLSV